MASKMLWILNETENDRNCAIAKTSKHIIHELKGIELDKAHYAVHLDTAKSQKINYMYLMMNLH